MLFAGAQIRYDDLEPRMRHLAFWVGDGKRGPNLARKALDKKNDK